MYAIFRAKGKQFRAEPQATLRLPSLEAEPGDRVTFDDVLLATRDGEVSVGTPAVRGASVEVEVLRHGKGDKIVVYKMKRRKGYRRKQGHRQKFTEVRIVGIDLPGAAPVREEKREEEPAAGTGGRAETAPEEAETVPATDAAAELAAEHGLDLSEIEGSGEGGRILKSDVQARLAEVEEEAGEAEEVAGTEEAPETQPETDAEVLEATDAARELADEHGLDLAEMEGTGEGGRVLKGDVERALEPDATDAAAELAAEHGLDLEEIEGTGEGGRILKGDVEDAIGAREEEEED